MINKCAVSVTGASSGIGRAIALLLDEKDFQVSAGLREKRRRSSSKRSIQPPKACFHCRQLPHRL